MDTQIANELIEMAQHDLRVREALLKANLLSPGYHPDMERVHESNAARLEEIIDAMGYPTRSKVGPQASEAAWLIVQHAIGRPAFMKRCYALIREAAGEVNPQHQAYLYDRICFFEGRPQRYGTQFDDRGLYPVENWEVMIRLREELGLPAHDEQVIAQSQQSADKMNLHPDNEMFNQWRKKVGWI